MKQLLRSARAGLLGALAKAIVRKYRPRVVMITGSVGKTSTKDAVAAALAPHFYLWASAKSFNSELGVPLTIIGAENPWSNPLAWLSVFGEGFMHLLFRSHYPKLLVLEVGADKPGDLAGILDIATPDAVIVTRLPQVPVHVEAYADPSAVREEEFSPAYALPPGAPLIVSSKDTFALELASQSSADVISVGFSETANVRVGEPEIEYIDGVPTGISADVVIDGEHYALKVADVVGRPQILAPANALALAVALGIPAVKAIDALTHYAPPPGRSRVLKGKDGSIIIDDTYNASPAATEEALVTLGKIAGAKRRIAVLGDMLELGRYSVSEHERIGGIVAEHADALITVGERAEAMGTIAAQHFPPDRVQSFANAEVAADFLESRVGEGDVILVKGSQSMRMERIVKRLLANPEDAMYLVRQDEEWQKR